MSIERSHQIHLTTAEIVNEFYNLAPEEQASVLLSVSMRMNPWTEQAREDHVTAMTTYLRSRGGVPRLLKHLVDKIEWKR